MESLLVNNISGSVSSTVESLENSVDSVKTNINRLTEVADEVTASSERAGAMQTYLKEVVDLLNSQEQAVHRITHSVNELFEVSGNTSKQTDTLYDLSNALGVAANDLNQVVDRFTL